MLKGFVPALLTLQMLSNYSLCRSVICCLCLHMGLCSCHYRRSGCRIQLVP